MAASAGSERAGRRIEVRRLLAMRIALISYEYPPDTGFGGIGTYTHTHAKALARLGHEVHVFAGTTQPERRVYRDGNVAVSRLRKVGPVERLMPRLDRQRLWWFKNRVQNAVSSFAALRRELAAGAFDVVEMPECGAEGALINHCLDLPTVVRLHSPAELIMPTYTTGAADRLMTAMIERIGLSGARAISSCSGWLAREVRERGLVTRPITVIPNGIDLAMFDQDEGIDIHAHFGVPRTRLKILFANRLEPRKGIHVVRDLLLPVLQRHPDATFVLAGADDHGVVDKELRPLLAANGLADRLVHLGRIALREVRACLKQCDIFLLPSIWENAPYSLLEAMAAGKAVVASDCGGIPEMLRSEVDGVLARTGDAASFARGLERLLSSDGLRARMGQSARARVEARYTDERIARRSLTFYEWALRAPVAAVSHEAVPDIATPSMVLGASSWFQAWWLRAAEAGEAPTADNSFGALGLDELAFIEAVSSTIWRLHHGRDDDPAAAYLSRLGALRRAGAVQAANAPDGPLVSGALGLPALSHPLFADDATADIFLSELWRLGEHAVVADWLVREMAAADFVEQATRRTVWRRLAVEAFRRRRGPETAGVLHRIYRTVATHARVVAQDLEFFGKHPAGEQFAAAVTAFGLHAPLQRPSVFAPVKKRSKTAPIDAEITVVIPSFRHEAFIARTIASVLAQTHARLRVLVVDDCSPDGTVAAARAIDDARVEVRVNPTNLGLGGSILAALPTIDTPFVAILNSDDLFHPERLERCLAVLTADPAANLVATGIAIMDAKDRRLTPDNVCVVDQGPAVDGWVRWYDRVTKTLAGDEWTAPGTLLRHNHLATSSNIVCRTAFLRDAAPALAPLKYCLDWSLFLRAATDGALRYLAEPTIGYRLHDSNTVWFDDEARPGYVHEVNAVVVEALRRQVARQQAEGVSPASIAEDLARLLLDSASAHGEVSGLAMALAELTAPVGAVPAAFRSPGLARLARLALESKTPAPTTGEVPVRRLLQHVTETQSKAVVEAQLEIAGLRTRAAAANADREDAEAMRARIRAERLAIEAIQGELVDAAKQIAGLHESLAATRDDLGRTCEVLDVARDELVEAKVAQQQMLLAQQRLQSEQQRIEAELRAARAAVTDLRSEVEVSARGIAQLEANRAHLRNQVAEGQQRIEEREAAIVALRGDLAGTLALLASAQQRLRAAADTSSAIRIAAKADHDRLRSGFDFRFGRLLGQKLRLLGPAKAVERWWTLARIGSARLFGGVRKSLPGSKPARILFVVDDAFPAADAGWAAAAAAVTQDAGIDTRIVSWRRGWNGWLDRDFVGTVRRAVLSTDRRLLARDRGWFERSQPAATAELLRTPFAAELLAPAFTFARSARSLSSAFVVASGFGPGGVAAMVASSLLHVPFGCLINDVDLERMGEPGPRQLALVAATLFVASEACAEQCRCLLGPSCPPIVVMPPIVGRKRPAASAPAGARVALVGPFSDAEGLLLLADAAKQLVARGLDLRLEVCGAELPLVASQTAIDWFRGRMAEHGLLDRCQFRPFVDAPTVDLAMNGCAVVFEPRVANDRVASAPTFGVLSGMAAGRAVVAFAGAIGDAVRDGCEGRIVALHAGQLADAIASILEDATSAQRQGEAARLRFDASYSPAHATAEMLARFRGAVNARR
jgi:glycogen synthase